MNWDYAQHYDPKEMPRSCLILIVCSLIGLKYPLSAATKGMAGVGFLLAVVVGMITRVEIALKRFERKQHDH